MTSRAGFAEPFVPSRGCVDDRIRESWINYLTKTLGRSHEFAREKAENDVTRSSAKRVIAEMASSGWVLNGAKILEIGSGHGSLAIEMAICGASVTAIEPCQPWRILSEERAAIMGLKIEHLDADAHRLPFPNDQFDGCVSLQVLEHVHSPDRVITEIARVLKPDGKVLITSENYLAFREPHYDVPWLPLLPKPLGSFYLKLMGRDPKFLRDHVTYVTAPGLAKALMASSLYDQRWESVLTECDSREETKRPFARLAFRIARSILGDSMARVTIACLVNRHNLFRTSFGIDGRKLR